MRVLAPHRPAPASTTDSFNRDSAGSSSSGVIPGFVSEPATAITTPSVVAEPRICMHMQDHAAPMRDSGLTMPDLAENMPASLEMEVEREMEGKGKWKNSKHSHTRAVPDSDFEKILQRG